MSSNGLSLELSDELVRDLFTRARELGLLPDPEVPRQWLTSKQAAEHLGVSVARVHSLVSEGALPKLYERGHRAVFQREDLDRYQAGGRKRTG